jgi:ABC-2 type transport system permease protein
MRKLLSLIWKELLIVVRDPRSRISVFLPPLLQLFIFSFAATLEVKQATIGVINRDNGDSSFELLQRFHGTPLFKEIIYLDAMEQIGPFLDQQKGLLVVSLDEQFSRNVEAKKQAQVQIICDGRRSNTTQILFSYVSQIIDRYARDVAKQEHTHKQNIVLVPRNWFNPNLIYLWYNIPCLVAVLAMLTCLVVTAQSIAREREMGTFDQLLVSPLSSIEILVGKTVPGIIIGLIEGILMWAAGVFLLGVPFTGSFILFVLSLFVFVTAISGVGIFISSLSATQQQALLGTFVVLLPSILLSGFATPIENMPDWLQPVTFLMPARYMLILSKGLFLKALSFSTVWSQIWPMCIIAFFTLSIAALLFRRRLS